MLLVHTLISVVGRVCAAHAGADRDADLVRIQGAERELGVRERVRTRCKCKLAHAIQQAQPRRREALFAGERGRRDDARGQARVERFRQPPDS